MSCLRSLAFITSRSFESRLSYTRFSDPRQGNITLADRVINLRLFSSACFESAAPSLSRAGLINCELHVLILKKHRADRTTF